MFERRFEKMLQLTGGMATPLSAILDCEARYWDDGGFSHRVCKIAIRYNGDEAVAEGPDFFDTFCCIRKELTLRGLVAKCYGSSRNVYPSGMCRDMGDGLRAYRLRLGHSAWRADLVNIFDDGPDVDSVSVEVQLDFWRSWLRSLRITPPVET